MANFPFTWAEMKGTASLKYLKDPPLEKGRKINPR